AITPPPLREVEERGELVSALGASESVIYGRFGYGLATTDASSEIDPRRAQFLRQPTGTARRRRPGPWGAAGRDPAPPWAWARPRRRPGVGRPGAQPPLRRGLRDRTGPGRGLAQL